MKVLISALAVLILMIGAQSAYAAELKDAPLSKHPQADLLAGLAIGAQDAKDNCNHPDRHCHWWILMRGNGFINQTQEFIKGYYHGFCSDPRNIGGGSDAEQADITCDDGPNGVRWAEPGSLDDNNTTFWSPN